MKTNNTHLHNISMKNGKKQLSEKQKRINLQAHREAEEFLRKQKLYRKQERKENAMVMAVPFSALTILLAVTIRFTVGAVGLANTFLGIGAIATLYSLVCALVYYLDDTV